MRVLSVVHHHDPAEGGGLFEELVGERGDRLERWVTVAGGTAPDPPGRYDAIMVFGGAMHPDQDREHPWLAEEASFIRGALDCEVPLLGVCLGAQLLARAGGATVGPAQKPEIGWTGVRLNDAGLGDPVIGTLPECFDAFQWHYYTFELPAGATLLAENEAARQAFRLGERAWGIQFHAEVTRPMVDTWCREGADELPDPAAIRTDTEVLLGRWNAHGRRLCGGFLDLANG